MDEIAIWLAFRSDESFNLMSTTCFTSAWKAQARFSGGGDVDMTVELDRPNKDA
jgi:hypothetical protein